ncbi:D-arabinono-1,4-lactone oxidase [Cystobacter fuscus]|uniref:D-arabinono-1,4-lactone oxidase n=1 Tax=Cystobacter fuscus TaxID=43 RepID=UPI002B2DF9EC|nr:FAD-binding protein [Cystobacter fuscus]
MSDLITIGQDGFYHPTNEQQIIAIIQEARARRQQVRVRGSGHTVAAAIYTSNYQKGMARTSGFNLMLDQMRAVTLHEETATAESILVTAEAGCNLGQDPHDPSATSTWDNSLFAQINDKGWAFPDTGGIIHQTVAGFISTGSAGGSLEDSVGDAIHAIRFIDGTGQVQFASREKNPELFGAAGVSLGLLGIITAVTFRCVRRFALQGTEVTTSVKDCAIDLFGPGDNGKPSLRQFLEQTEYARLLWWPQRGVEKMVVWQGKRIPYDPAMKVEPYVEIGRRFDNAPLLTLLTQVLGQAAGSAFYTLVGTWPQWVHALLGNRQVRLDFQDFCKREVHHSTRLLQHLFNRPTLVSQAILHVPEVAGRTTSNGPPGGPPVVTLPADSSGLLALIGGVLEWLGKLYDEGKKLVGDVLDTLLGELADAFVCWVIDLFVQDGTQTFQDYWYAALPMDNQISDVRMPTEFTELWVPLSRTQEVMQVLRKHYEEGGMAATGTYSCEIYSAKGSEFWLSPSYGEPVVRIDIFWFAYNLKDPSLAYYPQFWKLLAPYDFRPHWAKYLPDADSATGVGYLRALYPKWQEFMRLREQLDPSQLFVTDYWRWHLDIPAAVQVKSAASSAA